MVIEIHIPRPLTTFACLALVCGVFLWATSGSAEPQQDLQAATAPVGGTETTVQERVYTSELEIYRLRQKRALLERKEEVLRYQLKQLQSEIEQMTDVDPDMYEALRENSMNLIGLLQDKMKAEDALHESLQQLWEAQAEAEVISRRAIGILDQLEWPVEPTLGISAHFHDDGYKDLFGFDHRAIDIPVEQGTLVRAPADGVVEKVVDNGLGYSYLIVRHNGGATVYGHIPEFLVSEGQSVRTGDVIARSGGRPGSKGAGNITTGPHLHFEVIIDGEKVDPMDYMVDTPYIR